MALTAGFETLKEEFLDLTRRLAEESGQVIKRYFLSFKLTIETKGDGTLVTNADQEAEEVMRHLIHEKYPSHGIIGEEFGNENETTEFVWVLDPIDGTISFTSGCPLFGTLIGLLHQGKPVLGAINQPILNLLCIGDNDQTNINGKRVEMREVNKLSDATVLTTDVFLVGKYQRQPGFDNLVRKAKVFRTWGDCYGYLLLASGWADVMLDPIMSPWDILPLIPIIQGAGGVITTWDGNTACHGNSCVAASRKLHPLVLEILNT